MEASVEEEVTGDISALDARLGLYLSMTLSGALYAVPILRVREIIELPSFTLVPRSPAFLSGLINLRGQVITVIDLRIRIGLSKPEATARSCIILLEASHKGKATIVGVVVDKVESVFDVTAEDFQNADFADGVQSCEYLLGVATQEKQLVLLLDTAKVLDVD